MSFQELQGSFGAFSQPTKAERSRNKERLQASLAGLCELELLKQRQESRVLSALGIADPPSTGRPPWGALCSELCGMDASNGRESYGLKPHTSSLQCTPWGLRVSLEQQVAELKVNSEVKSTDSTDLDSSQLISGKVFIAMQNGSPGINCYPVIPRSSSAPEGSGEIEMKETYMSALTRHAMVTGALGTLRDADHGLYDYQQPQKVETYIFGLIQRRALPTRPSKPRTSLAHDARVVNVVKQSSLCQKDEQHSPKQVSVQEIIAPSQWSERTASQAVHNLDQEQYLRIGSAEDPPPPYHHHLQQKGPYTKPKQASIMSLDCPSCRDVQPDSSTTETDLPRHVPDYHSPPAAKSTQPSSPEDHLVSAEYIPAQPCRTSNQAYAHHHNNHHKGPGVSKSSQCAYSPERVYHQEQQPMPFHSQPPKYRGGPKKCRSNEDRSGASRKPGKKACRSQSENSLQRFPERKFNTVERDGAGSGNTGRVSRSSQPRSKKQQQGSGSYRRWLSTLELSQDETDQPPIQIPMQSFSTSNQNYCLRRTRKSRPTHASYAYPHHNHSHHHHFHHHHYMEYQLERDQVQLCQPVNDYAHPGQVESESSMSEADSPDSSSLSSDSDESGGLVWPQQLPPRLSFPSPLTPAGAPLQPKAFVKIKASHALKKKILRFRTGSLKVMTTV
ncbi:dapper homolog 3-like [Archocentrus centrarchus]|uniref:dapper homolog 3-like n=1 Tax=Archocentrus centrarchus TaxID=63155 RepID=UPI0011E9FF41|nr:dapper homolog 3-like [Archocentrus centrarchus]